MGLFDEITEGNLIVFAAKNYYNPKCIDEEEFLEDMNRFKYIKRLVNRYHESGNLSDRLILNHLIVIFNVFGISPAIRILKLKLNEKQWTVIKPFLVFLKYIKNEELTGIPMDQNVIEKLRKI